MIRRSIVIAFAAVFGFLLTMPTASLALEREELKQEAQQALTKFYSEVKDGKQFLSRAEGYLVFPQVKGAGVGVGGEYGQGILFIDGEAHDFYSTTAASLGATVGAQTKSIIVAFMTEEALNKFQQSRGWQVGVDGAITIANVGAAGSINTMTSNKSIVGFVFNEKGLMADLSLEGSKFTKIEG